MTARAILATISDITKRQAEEESYKIYTAECLRIITENTAKIVDGSCVSVSFADIIDPKPVDNRTVEEIAAEIIKKAGLEVV